MAHFKTISKDEFFNKCEKSETGCWLWKFAKTSAGYGKLTYKYRAWLAHRLSYYFTHGIINNFILHSCDTPACINPDHLRDGTQKDNMDDVKLRNRRVYIPSSFCKSGLHEMTQDNSYYYKGHKMCKTCRGLRTSESKERGLLFEAFL